MGILRRKQHEMSISRAGIKHRNLLEQPDVYFHGPLSFKIDGKYRSCLALLRPGHLSIRDRKHLEKIEATIRLNRGVTFHSNGAPSSANGAGKAPAVKAPNRSRMVKFEIHTTAAYGQGHASDTEDETTQATQEETSCHIHKYEFKCKSLDVRDLWKAHILAIAAGISPTECNVHLLPGQVMQIERLLEMEHRRRSGHRSSAFSPDGRLGIGDRTRMASQKSRQLDNMQHRGPMHKSKSLYGSAVPSRDAPSRHKFYKDGGRGVPSYFFEYISREMAEAILTLGHMYGNLLMRRSTTFPNSYALSFRSVLNRNTEIFHYEVGPFTKSHSLETYYEIKMEGKHPKFKCLNDVVKYFIKLTDGLAQCFITNDLEKLGIKQPPYSTHYEPPIDYDDHARDSSHSPINDAPRSSNALPRPPAGTSKTQAPKRGHDDPNSDDITILPDNDNDDDEGETRTFVSSNDSRNSPHHIPSPIPLLKPRPQTTNSDPEDSPPVNRRQTTVKFSLQDDNKTDPKVVTTKATISPVFERALAAQNQPGVILSPVAQKKSPLVVSESIDSQPSLSEVTMLAKPIPVIKSSVRASTENIHQASQASKAPSAVHKPASQSTSVASQTSQASAASSSASSAHSAVQPPQHTSPIPPPPPPPAVVKSQPVKVASNVNGQHGVVNKKPTVVSVSAAKGGLSKLPDRRTQFVPEKNLFRIALECEEKAAAVTDEEAIQDSSELASHLKGNVKSRIAFLEVNEPPAKAAAPNYSRPHKKDFMGELAERLKIRRQMVEQTCW